MYTKDNLPTGFQHYRKTALCSAVRIDGEFETKTLEGALTCKDGYLAIDIDGNPYPIDIAIFEKIYELV